MVFVVVLVAAVVVYLTSEPAPRDGAQVDPTGPIVLRLAADDGWERLVPAGDRAREGFPEPMVRRSGGICVGFGRLDFGPDDRRPSLARCERDPVPAPLEPNAIRSIVSIVSGFDTWHFLEAAAAIDDVRVELTSGEPLDAGRVLLADSTMALRLENGRDLGSIEWSTGAGRYRCTPDPAAWRTASFCTR